MHPIGQLTNIRRSDGVPEPDGTLKVVGRKKIIHYRQLYIDRPEPIVSALANDIPEESGHFHFLRAACLANIKGSVGLILAKASAMRISIPLDLSSRPFIPLPSFIRSRRPTTLLAPSLVFSPLRSVLFDTCVTNERDLATKPNQIKSKTCVENS